MTSRSWNGALPDAKPMTAYQLWFRRRGARCRSLLVHGHNLLAQLTVVKTMLMRRRNLDQEPTREPLQRASDIIASALTATEPGRTDNAPSITSWPTELPQTDPFDYDLSPWIVRRLNLACTLAAQLREDADKALRAPTEIEAEETRIA